MSDLSCRCTPVNYVGPRELLPSCCLAGDCSGMAREPRITPEVGNVLAQFFFLGRAVPAGGTSHMLAPPREENPVEEKVPLDSEAR